MSDPKGYLTEQQINAILHNTKRYRDKMLFYFIHKTGRRISEVVRCLKVSDIDFDKGLVNFTILKRKKPTKSLLPVQRRVLSKLKKYVDGLALGPDDYIFKISRGHADVLFKKAAYKAGIERVGTGKYNKPHIHLLRHSFAIRGAEKLKNPRDLTVLRDLLGHSSVDTTMHYLRFTPTQQRELLEEM